MRSERCKYIHCFTAPEEFERYDLRSDPAELHNHYADPGHAELGPQLAERLVQLRRETHDHYQYQPTVLLRPEEREGL